MKKFIAFSVAVSAMTLGGMSSALADGWTNWLNRDSPGGSGDYEHYSGFSGSQVCATPTKIEARISGQSTIYRPGDSTPNTLRYFNAVSGLACVNKDQVSGAGCQNYNVRFYCVEREDLSVAFPVLKKTDLQNVSYAQSAKAFRSIKKVNPPRLQKKEDIDVVQSLFRLGQGYDRINNEYRNECLNQDHPEFNVEQVPVTTPKTVSFEYISTSAELYEALGLDKTLGV